jgi:hypothetical protein
MIGLLLALLLAVYENTILDVMQLLRNALQITNWIQTMLDIRLRQQTWFGSISKMM